MDILKLLGGIGLVAGGLLLAFSGGKKETTDECGDYSVSSEDDDGYSESLESSGVVVSKPRDHNSEYRRNGADLNPYNRPDCLVPEEAYNEGRKQSRKGSRYTEDYYSEPNWIRGARLCTEGISNVSRGLLSTISDGLQFYGMYRSGVDVETYMEEYNSSRGLYRGNNYYGDYNYGYDRPSRNPYNIIL